MPKNDINTSGLFCDTLYGEIYMPVWLPPITDNPRMYDVPGTPYQVSRKGDFFEILGVANNQIKMIASIFPKKVKTKNGSKVKWYCQYKWQGLILNRFDGELFPLLPVHFVKFTRVDITEDYFNRPVSPYWHWSKFHPDEKTPPQLKILNPKDLSVETTYVGSPNSDHMTRVYNKKLELQKHKSDLDFMPDIYKTAETVRRVEHVFREGFLKKLPSDYLAVVPYSPMYVRSIQSKTTYHPKKFRFLWKIIQNALELAKEDLPFQYRNKLKNFILNKLETEF